MVADALNTQCQYIDENSRNQIKGDRDVSHNVIIRAYTHTHRDVPLLPERATCCTVCHFVCICCVTVSTLSININTDADGKWHSSYEVNTNIRWVRSCIEIDSNPN